MWQSHMLIIDFNFRWGFSNARVFIHRLKIHFLCDKLKKPLTRL